MASGGEGAVEEKFDGVGPPRHVEVFDYCWERQRRHLDHAFSGEAKSLPARHQHHDPVRLCDDLGEQSGGSYDVLEVIDDKQRSAIPEKADDHVEQ